MRINYRLGWLAVGGRGGRRAGSRVPLDGGRDTKQRGEDEAVGVSADLQTNEHASERDGQPADLSDILRCVEDARSFISLFRLGVREKKGECVSGRLAVGGPLGQRAVGCLCLGAWTHFYHRGAVRLSRQRQHGAIEQARWARAWPQDAGGGAGRGAGRQP